jgi:hypothetical protein
MKLDAARFAMAVATTWAVAGLLCGLIYKASPEIYNRGANFLLHSEMYRSTQTLGWGELLLAVVAWWVLVALLTGASAALYNRSVRV